MPPSRRPPTKTIKRVIEWLEQDMGLSIYGPNVNLEKEVEYPSLRDYTFDSVMKLAKLRKKHPNGIPQEDYD